MSAFSPGRIVLASLFASVTTTATPAMAGEALDGARLPWPLALPFAGILLSIALGPLAVKEWWHIHYAKAALFWAILALGGLIAVEGLPAAAAGFVHSMALEYLPFILMLFALFTAAGGISVEGKLNGSPTVNTTILALGTMIASIIGTTGASMILIRPLIRANSARSFNAHVVVFFIFLVSNIGGVLTPLGDPPLFLGFLLGIDFFWTARALWPQALFASGVLLAIFFLVDSYLYRREKGPPPANASIMKLRVIGVLLAIFFLVDSYFYRREKGPRPANAGVMKLRVIGVLLAIFFLVDSYLYRREKGPRPANAGVMKLRVTGVLLAIFFLVDSYFYRREKGPRPANAAAVKPRVSGLANIGLIGIAILAIAASGFWRPDIGFEVLGTRIELQNLVRELIMVFVGLASLRLTNPGLRAANGFEWEPIREVAYLFAGIFICIIPVMAMLEAGAQGPFSAAISILAREDGTPDNAVYFWATGILSSFLDNAPTYLVFFQLAGGDPTALMGPLAKTLTAISLGAVFMGANTYIGNAPNFMVYAIARRAGVKMPGFFPYMIWSGAILFPVFAAVTWLFLM